MQHLIQGALNEMDSLYATRGNYHKIIEMDMKETRNAN